MTDALKHIRVEDQEKALESLKKVILSYPKGSRVRQAYIRNYNEIKKLNEAAKAKKM